VGTAEVIPAADIRVSIQAIKRLRKRLCRRI
jgi:hypothetical protein